MALSEQRVIKKIEVLVQDNTIQVQWADQILRDEDVVSETYHRQAFAPADKDLFIAALGEMAHGYINAAGWVGADE